MGEVVYLNKVGNANWLSADCDFVKFNMSPDVLEESKVIVKFLSTADLDMALESLEKAHEFFLTRKLRMGKNVFQLKVKQ